MKKRLLSVLLAAAMAVAFCFTAGLAGADVSAPWFLAGYQAGAFGTASWTSTDASTISGSYMNGGAETAAPGSIALQVSPYKDNYTVSTNLKLTESDTFEWQRMSLVFWYKDDANYLMATFNHHTLWGDVCQAMIFGVLDGNWMTIPGQAAAGWWHLGDVPGAYSVGATNSLSVTKNGQVLNLSYNAYNYSFDFSQTSYDITGPCAYVGVMAWSTAVDFSGFSIMSGITTSLDSTVYQGSWDTNPALPAGCTADEDCVITFGTINIPTASDIVSYGMIVENGTESKQFDCDTANFPCNANGQFGIAIYRMPAGEYTVKAFAKLQSGVTILSDGVNFTVE
ncbi:MAG: hypothetical protein ACI4S9_02245 [Christensenellales bacterium]